MNNKIINRPEDSNIKEHISSSDISAFHQAQLSQSDLEKFLEHIGSCNKCSNLLAESMEEELISAPFDMKANILNSTKHINLQKTRNSKLPSKGMQLFTYSLRVITASAAAIALLVLTSNMTDYSSNKEINIPTETRLSYMDHPSFTSSIRNSMDQFTNQILEFSNTIIDTEVIENDQKEE